VSFDQHRPNLVGDVLHRFLALGLDVDGADPVPRHDARAELLVEELQGDIDAAIIVDIRHDPLLLHHPDYDQPGGTHGHGLADGALRAEEVLADAVAQHDHLRLALVFVRGEEAALADAVIAHLGEAGRHAQHGQAVQTGAARADVLHDLELG